MFNKQVYVRYGAKGIFQIQDIVKRKIGSRKAEDFYVLSSVYGVDTRIVTPVSNPSLRLLMDQTQTKALIESIPEIDSSWIEDKRLREDTYKKVFNEGDNCKLVQLIKMISAKKTEKALDHKTISRVDEETFERAEELLHEEISLSVQIGKDQVADYILNRLTDR